jgi:hypothetical protein
MAAARSPEATSAAIDTNLRELIGICQQTIQAAEEALGTGDPAPVLPKREPLTGYLQCQSLPGQLRYLAERLTEGSGPAAVALALRTIADEQDGDQE